MRRYDALDILLLVGGLATIIGITVLGVQDCKHKAKCRDNGGHVERYNCRTICSVDSNHIMTCTEHCDWRCVGANPEAR